MSNTMADLRREVSTRLRNALHGKEIDMMKGQKPELPHMLGITPLNKQHDPLNEEMTLLDISHPFWQEYEEDIATMNQLKQKIETAIRSLKEEGVLQMTYPYGEEADIIYVEVERLENESNVLQTSCTECGAPIASQLSLAEERNSYYISVSLDCDSCEFGGKYERNLVRR